MSTVINVKIVMSSFTCFLNTKSLKSRACFMSEPHVACACHIGQCGSERKGDVRKSTEPPGAGEGLGRPSSRWRLAVRETRSPPLGGAHALIADPCFLSAGLFWSSTTRSPGSRAIRPPRTAPPAFPSTLWCSLSCTMPS